MHEHRGDHERIAQLMTGWLYRDVGCTAHTRLFDRLEKRDGQWCISYRTCTYDFAHFNYPVGAVDVDRDVLAQYPWACAALAYVLHLRGYPLTQEYPTQGSAMVRDVKEAAFAWLDQEKIS